MSETPSGNPASSSEAATNDRLAALPALGRDRAFWGMTATQFFGAFNDNLFKQLVLLLCAALGRKDDLQGQATVIFAAPFILFSGIGGWLADRNVKRSIVVVCKIAEIAVMLLGMLAFFLGSLPVLFVALFLMGTQSAFFGPAKYGILPEMVRSRDLPRANGVILMTTFLAIIFGVALAGMAKDRFADSLHFASLACVAIAVVGTLTSSTVRRTSIAFPGLKFTPSAVAVNPDMRRVLREDRDLLTVLLISSVFWFVGGVVYPPAINGLGLHQMQLTDGQTSQLAACTGLGIAAGCMLAGWLSRDRINATVVRTGAWGMLACLLLMGLPGPNTGDTLLGVWGAAAALIGVGFFAGFFSVPLQVFLQSRAPDEQKGRIIGTMNLFNWIGIALSGVFYAVVNRMFVAWDIAPQGMFVAAAIVLLPVAAFFKPKSAPL